MQSDNEGVTDLASYIFQLEGKLLRPKFGMLLGYGLIPKEERGREEEILDKIKTWSAVIEMIHNSSLLQDDIIDNASVRRNRPTAHTIHGDTKTTILPLFIVGRAYV